MATQYTSLLGLALPVTGELSGSWGDTVNDAITSLLDEAVAGTTSITVDADITLTTTVGLANQSRQAIILWNPASGTTTRNITAPAQSKIYTVINASGGTQSIVFRGAGPTTGVTIVKGESALVAWNGADFIKVSNTSGAGTFTNLTVTGNTILGDASGDTITINGATTFANVNPTLTAGTANGVAYLNGSKVLTTGSALTFDGTNLGVGTSSPQFPLDVQTTQSRFQVRDGANTGGTSAGTGLVSINATATALDSFNYRATTHAFIVDSSEAMRLTSTGLGIGTSSPSTKLQVVGTGRFNSMEIGANNSDINNANLNPIAFKIQGTERMRLDTSGNLGLGVTPFANSLTGGSFDLVNGIGLFGFNNGFNFSANAFFSGGWKYKATAAACLYVQGAGGQHQWHNAPSGTAGNAISFTQAMTLDASGRLGVGTTSPANPLSVSGSTGTLASFTNGATADFSIICGSSITSLNAGGANILAFQTGGTERARIDSSGNLLVGTTTPVQTGRFSVTNTENNVCIGLSASGPGNTTGTYLNCVDNFDIRFRVFTNGNVQNTNNSYGAISDIKLKENVTDATPKLEKLQQVRVVNYNLIGDEQKQIGVIAQELEQIFPGMVDESPDRDKEGNDLGTTTKSVKYSVFVPMLIKAIQEQQALIQTLTARVAALESN